MLKKLFIASVAALALASIGVQAQTAPAPASTPNPVDPTAIQALKDMGAYLQTLKRFSVSTELSGERVLADGQKLTHMANADLQVDRPNRFRAVMGSARSERELIYDGKTVTLYTPAQKYYSSVAFTDTLGVLAQRLEERFGVEIPLSDLFTWGTPEAPLDKITSAMNAGQDFVGDVLCDHYAFRQDKIDWQIWISVGDKPLPRKTIITNLADEARPQSISTLDWNLKPSFTSATFRFVPPKGATKVELLPRKTQ